MQQTMTSRTCSSEAPAGIVVSAVVRSPYRVKTYRWGESPCGGHGPPYPVFPKPFVPWAAPPGMAPSGNEFAVPELPYTIQWTNSPPRPSGSVTISTYPSLGGPPVQTSGGDTSGPSQVYTAGIAEPEGNAELTSSIESVWETRGSWLVGPVLHAAAANTDAATTAERVALSTSGGGPHWWSKDPWQAGRLLPGPFAPTGQCL